MGESDKFESGRDSEREKKLDIDSNRADSLIFLAPCSSVESQIEYNQESTSHTTGRLTPLQPVYFSLHCSPEGHCIQKRILVDCSQC